jgi:mannose-6-phosphate isomerase-like protein (cupin superfamily)
MDAYQLSQVLSAEERGQVRYQEFMRKPSLSVGVYSLAAGARDPQQPHGEDEVYFVVGGRGTIRVGSEEQAVEAGSTVFVAAGVEHRFQSITEDLTILVFFAPAENTRRAA